MTPIGPRFLNLINDFVLLRFRARTPKDLSAIEVIYLFIIIIHVIGGLPGFLFSGRNASLKDCHASDVQAITYLSKILSSLAYNIK